MKNINTIKAINLDSLVYGMEKEYGNQFTINFMNKIEKCDLFKICEKSARAFFLSENENQIMNMFPEIKDLLQIKFNFIILTLDEIIESMYSGEETTIIYDNNDDNMFVIYDSNLIDEAKKLFENKNEILTLWNYKNIYQIWEDIKPKLIEQCIQTKIIEI